MKEVKGSALSLSGLAVFGLAVLLSWVFLLAPVQADNQRINSDIIQMKADIQHINLVISRMEQTIKKTPLKPASKTMRDLSRMIDNTTQHFNRLKIHIATVSTDGSLALFEMVVPPHLGLEYLRKQIQTLPDMLPFAMRVEQIILNGNKKRLSTCALQVKYALEDADAKI